LVLACNTISHGLRVEPGAAGDVAEQHRHSAELFVGAAASTEKEVTTMLLEYVQAALRHAKYEILPDDGSYYGEIPECTGVYANASTLEDCREMLREVLEEWLLFRVYRNLVLPVIDGIELTIKEVA